MIKDMGEIKVVVVSSVVTAFLLAIGASLLGLFEKRLSDSQVQEVARMVVDDYKIRETLISKMAESGKFKPEANDNILEELSREISSNQQLRVAIVKKLSSNESFIKSLNAEVGYQKPLSPVNRSQKVGEIKVHFNSERLMNLSTTEPARIKVIHSDYSGNNEYVVIPKNGKVSLQGYGTEFKYDHYGVGSPQGYSKGVSGETITIKLECLGCTFTHKIM